MSVVNFNRVVGSYVAAAVLGVVAASLASAAVVSTLDGTTSLGGNRVTLANEGAIETLATAGYVLYGTSTNFDDVNSRQSVVHLPSWATVSLAPELQVEYMWNVSKISAGGTTYNTGSAYYDVGTTQTVASLGTITLGADVPSSFTLGLLIGNGWNGAMYSAAIETSLVSGSSTATLNTADQLGTERANNFYLFTITGASAGDTIEIRQKTAWWSGYTTVAIGGITFSVVPEPASLGMLGLGAIAMMARRRHF